MICNKNKNSTGLINGYQGFARCAQILLATKIGGVTAIQKLWVKRTVGSWSPVGSSIVLVLYGIVFFFFPAAIYFQPFSPTKHNDTFEHTRAHCVTDITLFVEWDR